VETDPFAVSYSMRADAPPAMPADEYVSCVAHAWTDLVASDPAEPDVQSFLEAHPAMVPGADAGLGGFKSGHAPFPSALITQPTLRGLSVRTPDFLWIAGDSLFLNPVFVEIEAPDKRWVTASGQQHHELTQALHQLDEWAEWLEQPANRQLFVEFYDLPRMLQRKKWEPLFLLVYGRRSEDREAVAQLRRRLTTKTRFVIPYENLAPDIEATQYLCARRGSTGYVAVSVPATVELGPQHAEDWRLISGKQQAVAATPWLSSERREFLIERFPYWDEWGSHGRGVRRLSDVE
jgi:antiviral defense system Shedu protein SduA